jgi:hypothetical protein
MKNKKYYAIMQEKYKTAQGDTIIKEYVYDVEGFAPVVARNDAEAYAKENGYTVSMFCAYQQ